MASNTEIFLKFRERLINAITSNPEYKKTKAFGNFEAFIKSNSSYIATELKFKQLGTNYTKALDKGRGANLSNTGGLKQSIYDWLILRKYGLEWRTEKERQTLAFLITRKIAKEGTFKHRNKSKRTEIIESSIESTTPRLFEDLKSNEVTKIVTQIKTLYGDFNK